MLLLFLIALVTCYLKTKIFTQDSIFHISRNFIFFEKQFWLFDPSAPNNTICSLVDEKMNLQSAIEKNKTLRDKADQRGVIVCWRPQNIDEQKESTNKYKYIQCFLEIPLQDWWVSPMGGWQKALLIRFGFAFSLVALACMIVESGCNVPHSLHTPHTRNKELPKS